MTFDGDIILSSYAPRFGQTIESLESGWFSQAGWSGERCRASSRATTTGTSVIFGSVGPLPRSTLRSMV